MSGASLEAVSQTRAGSIVSACPSHDQASSETSHDGLVSVHDRQDRILTVSDHIEGAAEVARRQAKFDDDGVIDKQEQKAIDKAHQRQLEQRGRGKSQFKPWRTAKWMTRGVKDRMPFGKDKIRERE